MALACRESLAVALHASLAFLVGHSRPRHAYLLSAAHAVVGRAYGASLSRVARMRLWLVALCSALRIWSLVASRLGLALLQGFSVAMVVGCFVVCRLGWP